MRCMEMTVAFAFDTLGYAKRLREAGVSTDQAEAHAEAAREFIMTELVTKSDLYAVKSELDLRLLATRNDLQAAIDKMALQLTVRLGGIVVASVGLAVALVGFLSRLH
jgi:hypothetical protein